MPRGIVSQPIITRLASPKTRATEGSFRMFEGVARYDSGEVATLKMAQVRRCPITAEPVIARATRRRDAWGEAATKMAQLAVAEMNAATPAATLETDAVCIGLDGGDNARSRHSHEGASAAYASRFGECAGHVAGFLVSLSNRGSSFVSHPLRCCYLLDWHGTASVLRRGAATRSTSGFARDPSRIRRGASAIHSEACDVLTRLDCVH